MTAHVLGIQADGPGKGRLSPVLGHGGRALKVAVYDYNMGTDNYSANGNDIASIWTDFPKGVLYIGIEQMDTSTESEHREFAVDYTAKTLVTYSDTDATPAENSASNIGFVTVRLLVVGYA